MIIFYPISLIYGFFVFLRESLYRLGVIPSYKIKTKVISVGNLTFGGTGKTPVVDFLIQNLKKNKKIAVISRGYGRTSSGFLKVNPSEMNSSELYGDEPVLLSKKHPEVPIYVCEDRVKGCLEIEKLSKVDLIIADDAFQHLKLKRDKDILVIDATEKLSNYYYPPVGRARNSFCYLKRANIVFLTKTNLSYPGDLQKIKDKLQNKVVIEFNSLLDGLDKIPKEVFLISGIGKPRNFETQLKKSFPDTTIKGHFIFKDHHNYTESDISKIKSRIGNAALITTEKDSVKLSRFSKELNLVVAKIKFVPKSSVETLLREL